MTWPELEIHLSDREYFDLLDEFADEPHKLPPEIRALGPAPTPRALRDTSSPPSGVLQGAARGVPLSEWERAHLHADCHAGEPAVARLPDGRLACQWCTHGPER